MTPAEAILVAGQCDLSSFSDILLLLYLAYYPSPCG